MTWALARTFGSLRTLLPMTTRALPLLLLAITFLFINTEMWQVGGNLSVGTLWLVVLLFAVLAVGFLFVRLPEEVDRADDHVDDAFLLRTCAKTPLAEVCRELVDDPDADPASYAEVTGFERWNLILVLMIVQVVQVLLLSLSVFGFLMLFGSLIMSDPVMNAWQTDPEFNSSRALVQVSTFLAAFSGSLPDGLDGDRRDLPRAVLRQRDARARASRRRARRLPGAARPLTGCSGVEVLLDQRGDRVEGGQRRRC